MKKNNPIEQLWTDFGMQLADHICDKVNHQDYCHDILQEVYIKMVRNIDKIEKAHNICKCPETPTVIK